MRCCRRPCLGTAGSTPTLAHTGCANASDCCLNALGRLPLPAALTATSSSHTAAGKTGRYWGIGSGQTATQRSAFEQQLRQLDASLQRHGGPFLLGAHPSLADINIYPFLKRFDVGMRQLAGYNVIAALGGGIGAWLAAMDARPTCRTSAADSGLLLQAYEEHMSLDFFDYETFGCFQLHPHNAHLLE